MQELKLNMQTLLYTNLHLYWLINCGCLRDILNNKFLLLGDSVITSIDDHVDIVAESHHDSIVRFELLFHAIKGKIIGHIIGEGAWRLQVTHQLQKCRILLVVVQVLYHAHQLHPNPQMIQLLPLLQIDEHLSLHILSVLQHKCQGVKYHSLTKLAKDFS